MSPVNPDVDLDALGRKDEPAALEPPPRRPLRILVPLVLLAGFAAVLASSLGGLFERPVSVTIVRPRAASASGAAPRGTVLFKAAGWVEPEPYPVRVPALTEGVVKEILVLEAEEVTAGQTVATLIDEDATLALALARARHAQAAAAAARAAAEAIAAAESYDAALAVTEALATARATAAGKRAEAEHRAASVEEGRAEVRVAEEELLLQQHLRENGAAGPRQVELAEARLAAARSRLAILEADLGLARADAVAAEARLARAEGDLRLRTEEKLRLAAARADRDRTEAEEAAARAEVAIAELRLARTRVVSPVAGFVLERRAAPGADLGMKDADRTLVTLYDPRALRIRVDVPQGDVARAHGGQEAEIHAEARPGRPYHGHVVRIVELADISKTTLQVHVRVDDGDRLLRPDMLCQVAFLPPPRSAESAAAPGAAAVTLIPARLLVDGTRVWILDGVTGRATLRAVTAGGRRGDDIEIVAGLTITDRLVDRGRDGLREGSAVTVAKGE